MNRYYRVQEIFSARDKPDHFHNPAHCFECKEYDDILRTFDRDTIGFNEVGNLMWNPISDSSVEGFLYYLPALCRLSLVKDAEYYFVDQLLVYLTRDDCLDDMTKAETIALKEFLEWLKLRLFDEIELNRDHETIDEMINKLNELI